MADDLWVEFAIDEIESHGRATFFERSFLKSIKALINKDIPLTNAQVKTLNAIHQKKTDLPRLNR